ncbi:hypothetical protein GCM10010392_19680 [Streptomyces clavifer]|nr:hypothetical protein GCM10010392_19680 [Streptomyces clavifer]
MSVLPPEGVVRRQGHAFKPERRQKRNPLIRFFDPIVARVALHTGPLTGAPEPAGGSRPR